MEPQKYPAMGESHEVIRDASTPTTSSVAIADRLDLSNMRFLVLTVALAMGLLLAIMDTAIVATCLFSIAQEFRVIDNINWVALGYTLAYLGCAVFFARITDVLGRKHTYLLAYLIFVAFSLGCGWAQNLNQLIAFRTLQGLGGSGLYTVTMILYSEVTPDRHMKWIGATVGIVMALSGVLGPVLGGVFTQASTWRWVFWLNGPVGGVGALVFILAWPGNEYLPPVERRKFRNLDYPGSFLLIAAAILVVFSFQNASTDATQWSQAVFIAPLLTGLLAFAVLFGWQLFVQKRWKNQVAAAVPLELVRNRVYTFGVFHTMCTGFGYFMAVYVLPTRFQVVNGKNPLEAGVMLLPLLGGGAIGTMITGAVNSKQNRLFESMMLSSCLMILGCGLQTFTTSSAAVDARTLGFMVFMGFAFGVTGTASTMLATLECSIHENATGQALLNQVRMIGASLGIAASSAIQGVKTHSRLTGVIPQPLLLDLAHNLDQLTEVQREAVREAYTDAFHEDMIVACCVAVLGLVFTLGTYRRARLSVAETQQNRYRAERERKTMAKAKHEGTVNVI